MKRFQFKLAAVLRHRHLVEGQRLQQMASVQAELRECEHRLRGLHEDAERTLREWPGHVDVVAFALRERYLEATAARIEAEERVHEAIAGRVEEARTALLRARLDRETMERMEAQAHQEYLAEAERVRQAELDEIASVRHARAAAAAGTVASGSAQ